MAYTKTTWVNEGPPAIDADNLNKIENGIYNNEVKIDAIQDWLTTNIRTGITSSVSVASGGYTDIPVTLSPAMDSAPQVMATLYSTSTAGAIGSMEAATINVSKTGFTIRVFNDGNSARSPSVRWIAIAI